MTVLTVGPEQATDALQKALQMGADKAVHVVDDAIHGSDALATSLVLAAAIKKLDRTRPRPHRHGLDRRHHGRRPGDARRAPGAAAGDVRSRAHRRGRHGHDPPRRRRRPRSIESSLPALVSVTDQINEPRYPSFKGIMAAKKKPLRDVVARRPRHRRRPGRPRRRLDHGRVGSPRARRARQGQIVTDEGDGGAKLAEFLAEREVRLTRPSHPFDCGKEIRTPWLKSSSSSTTSTAVRKTTPSC